MQTVTIVVLSTVSAAILDEKCTTLFTPKIPNHSKDFLICQRAEINLNALKNKPDVIHPGIKGSCADQHMKWKKIQIIKQHNQYQSY